MDKEDKKINYQEAEELYYTLRKIYNSPFYDNKEDRNNAIFTLMEAINKNETNKEFMIVKMKVIASKSFEDIKHKLSNIILSKYWL